MQKTYTCSVNDTRKTIRSIKRKVTYRVACRRISGRRFGSEREKRRPEIRLRLAGCIKCGTKFLREFSFADW